MSALNPTCNLVRAADAIYRDKGNGTRVSYYILPEYEIHTNSIDPDTVQEWHHHERIIETLLVIDGVLEARWVDDDVVATATLCAGDLIEVGTTVHTFANTSAQTTKFLVFRLVPDGVDKRELIRSDRFADADPAP